MSGLRPAPRSYLLKPSFSTVRIVAPWTSKEKPVRKASSFGRISDFDGNGGGNDGSSGSGGSSGGGDDWINHVKEFGQFLKNIDESSKIEAREFPAGTLSKKSVPEYLEERTGSLLSIDSSLLGFGGPDVSQMLSESCYGTFASVRQRGKNLLGDLRRHVPTLLTGVAIGAVLVGLFSPDVLIGRPSTSRGCFFGTNSSYGDPPSRISGVETPRCKSGIKERIDQNIYKDILNGFFSLGLSIPQDLLCRVVGLGWRIAKGILCGFFWLGFPVAQDIVSRFLGRGFHIPQAILDGLFAILRMWIPEISCPRPRQLLIEVAECSEVESTSEISGTQSLEPHNTAANSLHTAANERRRSVRKFKIRL